MHCYVLRPWLQMKLGPVYLVATMLEKPLIRYSVMHGSIMFHYLKYILETSICERFHITTGCIAIISVRVVAILSLLEALCFWHHSTIVSPQASHEVVQREAPRTGAAGHCAEPAEP